MRGCASDSDHITEMAALRRSVKPGPSARGLIGTPNLMRLLRFGMTDDFRMRVYRPAKQGR